MLRHAHRAIGAAIGEERAYSYAYISYDHMSGGGEPFVFVVITDSGGEKPQSYCRYVC